MPYEEWADAAIRRFDAAKGELGLKDYFAHASIGWDTNPRFPPGDVQPSVTNSSPVAFESALKKAKAWTDANARAGAPKLITVNSWNEWTEGSYLEPDALFGFGYLEAVRRVFCTKSPRRLVVGISDMCKKDHNTVEEYYARALVRCGHIPVLLPKTEDEEALTRTLDLLDAVIVSGGGPSVIYDECLTPLGSGTPKSIRNRFDSAILRYAASRRMPVLGICRGEQVMNVAFGGTLYTNLHEVVYGKNGKPSVTHGGRYSYFGAATNPPAHTVSIVPGTKLAKLIGTNDLAVASHHVQAVNSIAPGFRVCAYAPDGVVEAIESETLPMIGVQFHPETVVAERPAQGFDLPRLETLFRRIADFDCKEEAK